MARGLNSLTQAERGGAGAYAGRGQPFDAARGSAAAEGGVLGLVFFRL